MEATTAPAMQSAKGGVGTPISRVDGRLKVTGRATYAAEAPVKGVAHAVLVSSAIAAGKIKSMDVDLAKSAPGVLRVVTPKNVENLTTPKKGNPMEGGGLRSEERLALEDLGIDYAGQYVAAVVAETLEQAQHAAALISIEYDESAPIFKLQSPQAKVEKPKDQFGEPLQVQKGDVNAVLKSADASGLSVVSATYTTPVETHNPMELHATIAAWDGPDKLTVWDATQFIMGVRDTLSGTFKLKPQNVRVICPFVGGGFGCKGAQWPHTSLAAALARMVGRPVKLVLTRAQMFTGTGHRPSTEQKMTLAASKDGKLAAVRHTSKSQGSTVGDFIETCGLGTSRVLYATPNMEVTHESDKVNVAPPTFMRAPGEAPGTFALESAMDELSYAVGIDPMQLRLVNYADMQPESGKPWSSKNLKDCYRIGAEQFGWSKRDAKPGSMKTPQGLAMGWGMATATYPGNRFPGTARIRLMRDDAGELRAIGASSTQDLGTGSWTIFTQITATETGLPAEKVKFELGDSTLPPAPVSGGSTSAASVGQALHDAGLALKQNLLALATQGGNTVLKGLTADELLLKDGRLVAANDPSRGEEIAPLIARSGKAYVEGFAGKPAEVGTKMQPGGVNYAENKEKYETQSFGAHFVEVVIEQPGTRVRVSRVVSVIDIGRVINPKTARSQVIGGVVMGIGMALLEETVYDAASARPVTDNLADYAVCVNADIPEIETHFIDIPDTKFNALGVRGVGEIGITGVAAAVANAVYHATGKRVRELPITMDKLLA